MAGTHKKDDDDIVATINVTPLVDITLVLLIVFMVTAAFIRDPVVPVELPRAANADDAPARSVAMVVDAEGQLFVNGRESTHEQAQEILEGEVRQDPEVSVVVAGDGQVNYQVVMSAIDITREVGVRNLALNVQRAASE
jgi:biopolymer transport protein ExbD